MSTYSQRHSTNATVRTRLNSREFARVMVKQTMLGDWVLEWIAPGRLYGDPENIRNLPATWMVREQLIVHRAGGGTTSDGLRVMR